MRAIKKAVPDIGILCDVALDPYTTHGHDGVMDDSQILNDKTVEILCKQSLIQAQAAVEVLNAARPKKEPRDFGLDIPSPVVLAERRRDLASQIVAGLPMYGPPYLEGGAEADSHRRAAEAFIEQKLGEVPVRG